MAEVDNTLSSSSSDTSGSGTATAVNVLPTHGVQHEEAKYFMGNAKRGTALIFNHYKFANPCVKKRKGTKVDRKKFEETFLKLGFKVECLTDQTHEEITGKLNAVALQNHKDDDCLVVAVLTHGGCDGSLRAYDRRYKIEDLWKPFIARTCRGLEGKPKLFFVQACRGSTCDRGVILKTTSSDVKDEKSSTVPYILIPSYSDILISYATFEDLKAFRYTYSGSLYVQTLCHQLDIHAGSMDLLRLLTRVNRIVGQKFRTHSTIDPSLDGLVQGPCFLSSLTRRLYLSPPAHPATTAQ